METLTSHLSCVAWLAAACSATAAQDSATFAMRSLTPQAALRAAQATLQDCTGKGYQVAVSVLDRTGTPLVMLRERLAGMHTPQTADGKAYTAIAFKLDTLTLSRATQADQGLSGLRHLPRVVAVGGGRIIEAGGTLVGAIGVSGAPGGEADDACARAGIAAIQADLDF